MSTVRAFQRFARRAQPLLLNELFEVLELLRTEAAKVVVQERPRRRQHPAIARHLTDAMAPHDVTRVAQGVGAQGVGSDGAIGEARQQRLDRVIPGREERVHVPALRGALAPISFGSVMSATSRRRPLQGGQHRTSTAKVRFGLEPLGASAPPGFAMPRQHQRTMPM